MRYVEVTHKYVLPVPDEDADPAELDAVMNAGVSIMEKFIKQHGAAVRDLRSDWQLMPKEFHPEWEDEISIEPAPKLDRDTIMQYTEGRPELGMDPGQVSFTSDIMGQRPNVTHPWDQGLRVTPPDHPLAAAETEALRQEDKLCGYGFTPREECILVKGHSGEHYTKPLHQIES